MCLCVRAHAHVHACAHTHISARALSLSPGGIRPHDKRGDGPPPWSAWHISPSFCQPSSRPRYFLTHAHTGIQLFRYGSIRLCMCVCVRARTCVCVCVRKQSPSQTRHYTPQRNRVLTERGYSSQSPRPQLCPTLPSLRTHPSGRLRTLASREQHSSLQLPRHMAPRRMHSNMRMAWVPTRRAQIPARAQCQPLSSRPTSQLRPLSCRTRRTRNMHMAWALTRRARILVRAQ